MNDQLLHITHKEAKASALAVLEVINHVPTGSTLSIETDAVSTAWAWKKGSKLKAMNLWVANATIEASKAKMFLRAKHIAGVTNTRADALSRRPDPKSYRLSPASFHQVCRHFRF